MIHPRSICVAVTLAALPTSRQTFAQEPAPPAAAAAGTEDPHAWRPPGVNVGGIFPHLTAIAPAAGSTTEAGIGALIPWAGRLWAVGYVAHIRGSGLGLYEIREDMAVRLHPESVTGTFANRMIHWETRQAIIGPHLIDEAGRVRTFPDLSKHRLAATARHLAQPKEMAYFLTMEGLLFEANLRTMATRQVANLVQELKIDKGYIHFKAAHTAQGRLVVANNSYNEQEFLGKRHAGRLAEWDGKAWSIVEDNPFVEVSGKNSEGDYFGGTLFAVGWDRSSVILRVLHDGKWTRYRLPKASQTFDHEWNTEWMRIREAQTERYLLDAHGMFYELPALVYGGRLWGVRPIAHHLRIVPDYCHWRGLFVMAGDQTDRAVGQPQSGLWFGAIDDLWKMGKPTGWGGVWWDEPVQAGAASDPFLMTGFDKKVLHLTQTNPTGAGVNLRIEVDFRGDGQWSTYRTILVRSGVYEFHAFPDGFAAHWVRVVADGDCQGTAQFHYN